MSNLRVFVLGERRLWATAVASVVLLAGGLLAACGGTAATPEGAEGGAGSGGASSGGPDGANLDPAAYEEFVEALRAGWATKLTLPEDARPEAPEWDPPFAVGAPGWRASTGVFCQPFERTPDLVALWATEDAAFAAVARHCSDVLAPGEDCDEVVQSAIFRNDGNGWTLLDSPALRLPAESAALADGRVLFGMDALYDPSERRATILENPAWGASPSVSVAAAGAFAVASTSSFSIETGGATNLWTLSGNGWTALEFEEGSASSVAVNARGDVFVGRTDRILVGDAEGFSPVEGVPAAPSDKGLWAESVEDLCAVSDAGELACVEDGRFVVEAALEASRDVQFATAGGRLYFLSERDFGYLEDGEATFVIRLPASRTLRLEKLAASPSGDVFVGLRDESLNEYACGSLVTLTFAGAELHRF